VSTHQLGQAVFRSVLPEDMDWEPFPAFPPAARLAVVVGDPSQPAPYVVRVKRHPPFPLGQIRGVRNPGNGVRADQPGISRPG
jgi:hypothetical protein